MNRKLQFTRSCKLREPMTLYKKPARDGFAVNLRVLRISLS
jgi:hypothetical protein